MSATYYLVLTAYGAARIAQLQADQSSAPLAVNFVAGDANGQPYLPQTRIAATGLIHQRVSVPLQSVDVVDDDTCQAVAVLDATVGGFNIHEIGITDATGQLIYIGNYHGGYKPVLSEGAGGDLTVVLDLVASGIGTVVISLEPSFEYASKEWVDANFTHIPTFDDHVTQNNLEHANLAALVAAEAQARNAADQQHSEATDPHDQYAMRLDATESIKGIVRLATEAETAMGTSKSLATHPKGVRDLVDAYRLTGGISNIDTLKIPIVREDTGNASSIALKYGEVFVESGTTVAYPDGAFSNATHVVIACQTASSGTLHNVSVGAQTSTGFVIWHSHSNPISIAYYAIGY